MKGRYQSFISGYGLAEFSSSFPQLGFMVALSNLVTDYRVSSRLKPDEYRRHQYLFLSSVPVSPLIYNRNPLTIFLQIQAYWFGKAIPQFLGMLARL